MYLQTSMRISRACVIASFSLLLSACTGETVSKGVATVTDVKEWFQPPEPSTSNAGFTSTGAVVPAAALPTDVDSGNVDQSGTDPDTGNVDPNNPEPADESTPYVDSVINNSEDLVPIPESETSLLTSSPDFTFRTARFVKLKVDLGSVSGIEASLSLCTDYETNESGYEINYDSCPIRGVLIDGKFESDVALVNQYESAIAVIWFPYQESEPLYRKFDLAGVASQEAIYVWLWN